jgi:hypothetical protein
MVIRKYKKRCACCAGKEKLIAHHIVNYSHHYDVNNGICLCKSCHWKYHSKHKNINDISLNIFLEKQKAFWGFDVQFPFISPPEFKPRTIIRRNVSGPLEIPPSGSVEPREGLLVKTRTANGTRPRKQMGALESRFSIAEGPDKTTSEIPLREHI